MREQELMGSTAKDVPIDIVLANNYIPGMQ
jgi:hypothetical protein